MQNRSLLNRSRLLLAGVLAAALAGTAGVAKADFAISVGDLVLNANQANQVRTLNFSGSGVVDVMEFVIQVGDGLSGPTITAIDLKTGTFASSADQTDSVTGSWVWKSVVDMSPISITGGLLATVTFDTTGLLAASTQPLLLSGVAGTFNTSFFSSGNIVPVAITNGTISVVVPEPASLGLLGVGAAGLLRRRRR